MEEIFWILAGLLWTCFLTWLCGRSAPSKGSVLPPGSLGLPFIGESLELLVGSYSLELHPFLQKRIKRYGKIFKTRIGGSIIVVSADPEFSHFILAKDGEVFEPGYLDTMAKIFLQEPVKINLVHRYIRKTALQHIGGDALKNKVLPMMEKHLRETLGTWSEKQSINLKEASVKMALEFSLKLLFGYECKLSADQLGPLCFPIIKSLMSLPVNIPGTTHYKCLKNHKKALSVIREILKERMASSKRSHNFLDQVVHDMKTEIFLTEDFVTQLLFALLFVSFDTVTTIMTLSLKLITEHPPVLEELKDEHDAILKGKEDPDSPVTWMDYKSMAFTSQVINEVLRLGSLAPGLFRKATEDVTFNGYTIPAGGVIMVAVSALHMDPEIYGDPATFNPWRWEDGKKTEAMVKNLMPFGWGMRQCAGAQYARMFLATFIHVLITEYRWKVVKGGDVCRAPALEFGEGLYVKFIPKNIIDHRFHSTL